jgi:YHS domain-containing protein
VCGIVVDPINAKDRAEHDGQTLYFCRGGCKAKFLADPAQFLKAAEQSVVAVSDAPLALPAAGTIFTCPMHPQIRRNAPGSCPICGMTLEPAGVPQAGTNPELKDMTRRGIAMGTGTDVAMQSAGITLIKGDLAGIARGRALGRATMRNIRENLVLALVYNVVCIPVAAGVLYPAFGLLLSPIIAAVAMSLSSVSVIGNALRLRFAR